jgi:hypothetical protein
VVSAVSFVVAGLVDVLVVVADLVVDDDADEFAALEPLVELAEAGELTAAAGAVAAGAVGDEDEEFITVALTVELAGELDELAGGDKLRLLQTWSLGSAEAAGAAPG